MDEVVFLADINDNGFYSSTECHLRYNILFLLLSDAITDAITGDTAEAIKKSQQGGMK